MSSRFSKCRFLVGSALPALTLISVGGLSAPAVAQNTPAAVGDAQADTPPQQEIVVTGSRIARPGTDTPMPVTVRTATEIFRTGATNVGDTLTQQLPQLAPTYTQASSLGGGNAIGTAGLDILDLRNIGVARTLTLVNGRRHITSIEGEFLVDTNTIPSDLLDRVDVVTGGSSAVYGSDAMAGVVNFVLKRDFEGATFNAQGGTSSRNDRTTYKASATFGKNFAEGRGNIAVSLEYNHAEPIYYAERDRQTGAFSGRNQFQLVNPVGSGLPERSFRRGVHSYGYADGGAFIPYNGSSVRACGDVAEACLANGFPRVFQFQPNGSLTEDNYGVDFRPVGSNNSQYGSGSTLNNTGVLIPGLERYVVNALGHFDVSDAFRPYFEAKFVRVKSWQDSSGTFSQGGPQGTDDEGNLLDPENYYTITPISLDNAFLTPQSRALISSLLPAGATFFNLNRNNIDTGLRGERNRRDTYRFVGGVEGTFNDDWHYDVSATYGKLKTRYLFTNNRLEQNFYNSIDAVFNGAGQIVCRINQAAVTDPNCQPINLLGSQANDAQRRAALAYFNTTSRRWGQASELDINGSVSGDLSQLFELPGGPIRFALGGEYRRETASYRYDDVVTSGATFLNAIQPFNPPAFKVKEAFAEVEAPLLADRPFFNELTLNGAARVADYNGATGTVWAYNGGVVYSPVRGVRFRGNYSRSVRAPTLGDLYTTPNQDYRSINDPCDVNFINSGKSTRPANCAAAGVPVGFENNVTRSQTLTIQSGGNPDLTAEKSRSWTYGVVLTPAFARGLTVSVDYYDIKISNVISPVDSQDILDGCYDGADLNNQFCNLIRPRAADGNFQIPALLESTLNFAQQRARGIDLDVSYNRRLTNNDRLALRFVGSWIRTRNDFTYLDDPEMPDRTKGELGTPIYRFNVQADYTHKNVTLGYTMRYVGKQSIADWEMQHATAGVPDSPYNPLYADVVYYPKAVYHDINVNVEVNNRFSLYGGVNNLTDKLPPYGLLGLGGGGADGTGNDGLYDNVGRFMYLGFRVKL